MIGYIVKATDNNGIEHFVSRYIIEPGRNGVDLESSVEEAILFPVPGGLMGTVLACLREIIKTDYGFDKVEAIKVERKTEVIE